VLSQEAKRGKVPKSVQSIYDSLYRATAWQESCWRQFVERRGELQPIRSSAGSIGMMQVNQHVWRGIYDVAKLSNDIAYNARAGNEILVHYLVDYAIKKKEHEITGSDDNLARATYAVYNGGPRHLSRYRMPETKKSLRAIDEAFWRKYERIKQHGANAVRQCYGE
jgi:soluble lytic murein transglycosylase-like protein